MDHDDDVITQPKFRMWLRPDGVVRDTALTQPELAGGASMTRHHTDQDRPRS
jgi:hypothetical protein